MKVTADLYTRARHRLAELGYGDDYTWSQGLRPPETAEAFACEYTWVVINSGMKNTVAHQIFNRVWPLVVAGQSIADVFGHKGKVNAISHVWRLRADYFSCFRIRYCRSAADLVAWCETLPWIGAITKYHLAKNLGADVAKPDRWLVRLANAGGETVDDLCVRLARDTGDRVATVDLILWRACAVGVLTVSGAQVGLESGKED